MSREYSRPSVIQRTMLDKGRGGLHRSVMECMHSPILGDSIRWRQRASPASCGESVTLHMLVDCGDVDEGLLVVLLPIHALCQIFCPR